VTLRHGTQGKRVAGKAVVSGRWERSGKWLVQVATGEWRAGKTQRGVASDLKRFRALSSH